MLKVDKLTDILGAYITLDAVLHKLDQETVDKILTEIMEENLIEVSGNE
ncbi:hypothetical protein [Scopulibacillus darangshiensis]|nr:hypothetical protein [Scopulibacillus darangshiensis]